MKGMEVKRGGDIDCAISPYNRRLAGFYRILPLQDSVRMKGIEVPRTHINCAIGIYSG
jgi:hypothetical protein